MIPSAFVSLETLPRLPNGKVDRAALPAPEQGVAAGSRAPKDRIELDLAQIWGELLGARPIDAGANFFALGGHSLLAVRLIAQIRQRFGVELPLTIVFERPTLEQLASLLRREQAIPRPSPLVKIQERGTGRPFFCVHPIGGNVFCYWQLARELGSAQPFYGLQTPEPELGVQPAATIEAMASEYLEAVRSVAPEGPYRLGGWSMGGLVAFEMARQLLEAGEAIEILALLDTAAPRGSKTVAALDDTVLIAEFSRDLGALTGAAIDVSPAELAPWSDERRWLHVLGLAQAAGALPPEIDLATLRRHFEAFKRNRVAMLAYRPQPFSGHLVLYAAESSGELARRDPSLGWAALAAGGVEVVPAAGDHYGMLEGSHVATLAEDLARKLNDKTLQTQNDRRIG
ncbi:MAG: hypothetical protein HC897_02730 [Thermoanaerobaculia bacterium]|nr:hypothetical protein [Thermoanaerobaculia bacterium]